MKGSTPTGHWHPIPLEQDSQLSPFPQKILFTLLFDLATVYGKKTQKPGILLTLKQAGLASSAHQLPKFYPPSPTQQTFVFKRFTKTFENCKLCFLYPQNATQVSPLKPPIHQNVAHAPTAWVLVHSAGWWAAFKAPPRPASRDYFIGEKVLCCPPPSKAFLSSG